MIQIVNFIKENSNWEKLLSSKPYSLSIKRKDSRILFKYSQIDSDPSLEIVKEARGLILEDGTWNVVAYPFKRFFNYGEPNAAAIDWTSARVQTKEDGSLIKVYFYNGEWKVGTSGTIDAEDAELNSLYYSNFRQLFDFAAKNSGFDYDKLDPHFTYIFELLSPVNQIVCPQTKTRIVHIGTRDNRTCEEVEVDIGVEKPKEWKLSSLEDCIVKAKQFDYTQEGFVVRDRYYNRIKVKSEDYVRVHRLSNNNNITLEKGIELVRNNETLEFLTYFPKYKNYLNDINTALVTLSHKIKYQIENAKKKKFLTTERSDFAKYVTNNIEKNYQYIWYKVYDNYIDNPEDFISSLTNKQIAKQIEIIIKEK